MNMVRNMLFEKEIPKRFQPEAVKWEAYVQNRIPSIAVKDLTPEEVQSGTKPSVHFFRIFDCIGYVHVLESKRKKLDNRRTKCILHGVSEESQAYRLYDPVSIKILTSRDVVFGVSEKSNWNKEKEESPEK